MFFFLILDRRYSHCLPASGPRSGTACRECVHHSWRCNWLLLALHHDWYQSCHQKGSGKTNFSATYVVSFSFYQILNCHYDQISKTTWIIEHFDPFVNLNVKGPLLFNKETKDIFSYTVKLLYNDHPWDPKFVAVADRWLLFRGCFMLWKLKMGPQNCGRCRQVVVIWRWSLTQVWLYTGFDVILFFFPTERRCHCSQANTHVCRSGNLGPNLQRNQ